MATLEKLATNDDETGSSKK